MIAMRLHPGHPDRIGRFGLREANTPTSGAFGLPLGCSFMHPEASVEPEDHLDLLRLLDAIQPFDQVLLHDYL